MNPKTADKAKYTLNIYVDYQCPHCKETEEAYGKVFKQLADEGFAKVQVHTMTFMDRQTQDDTSVRMAIGAACADVVGKYEAWHEAAWANQQKALPLYSKAAIESEISQQAGITGDDLTKWKQCLDNKATADFITQVDENAGKAGVTGTPTIMVDKKNPVLRTEANGDKVYWWQELNADPAEWKAAIEKAAKS